jgi:molybdenum cofactor cytidylyltransferase
MIAAIVPAAGKSARMGQAKLLLKLGGQALIARVVTALRAGGAKRVIVVAPPAESSEARQIVAAAEQAGAEVIVPRARPAEMRDSVELAIALLARDASPQHVLLTPADTPGITSELVVRLVEATSRWPERIVVPCCDGRRGHPISLPWSIAAGVKNLPAGLGVNTLVARHSASLLELPVSEAEVAFDLDTPEDLRRWQQSGAPGTHFTVRLFALAKERVGRPEIEIELPPESRVVDLRAALREHFPELRGLLASALIAVDEEYANDDVALSPSARIALIPPVSGGADQALARELPPLQKDHAKTPPLQKDHPKSPPLRRATQNLPPLIRGGRRQTNESGRALREPGGDPDPPYPLLSRGAVVQPFPGQRKLAAAPPMRRSPRS